MKQCAPLTAARIGCHFEPSLDALSLRSDVICAIKVLSLLQGAAVQTPMAQGRSTEIRTTYEATLPWREAGPPNRLNDKVDPYQQVVNKLSLKQRAPLAAGSMARGRST